MLGGLVEAIATVRPVLCSSAERPRHGENGSMIKRILAAMIGAVLFGILAPLTYILLLGVPQSLMNFVWLAVAGVVVGAVLGALLPRVFGFVFELLFDV